MSMALLPSYWYVLGSQSGIWDIPLSAQARAHRAGTPCCAESWGNEELAPCMFQRRTHWGCTTLIPWERDHRLAAQHPSLPVETGITFTYENIDVILANFRSLPMFTLCRKLVEEKYEENNKRMRELRSRNFQRQTVDVLHVSVLLF